MVAINCNNCINFKVDGYISVNTDHSYHILFLYS